jgi:hypothetical protein
VGSSSTIRIEWVMRVFQFFVRCPMILWKEVVFKGGCSDF